MILMEFAAGAGILLEKWLSGHHCAEDHKNPEKYQKFLFSQMTDGARRADLGGPPWAQTRPRRGPLAGRAWGMSGRPGPPLTKTFRVYHPHGNLRSRGETQKYSAAATRRKTPEREKLSGRRDLPGETPSRRGRSTPSSPPSRWTPSGSSSSPSPPSLHL